MAKYYVRSGELERIVTATCPLGAAEIALLKVNGETLDKFFYIDERGFRGPTQIDNSIDTDYLPEHSLLLDEVCQTEGEDGFLDQNSD